MAILNGWCRTVPSGMRGNGNRWRFAGEVIAVSGGLPRLVTVEGAVGMVGSCWPSASTASACARYRPPLRGTGYLAVQPVDAVSGWDSVASHCVNTLTQRDVAGSHHVPAFVSVTATSTRWTEVSSV